MLGLFTTAAHVATPIALAAFVIAAIIFLIDRNLKSKSVEAHRLLRIALMGSLLIVVIALGGEFYLRHESGANTVYRVRIALIGPNELPPENAKIQSSVGGEIKSVDGGFELDIPAATLPSDGKVTFSAEADGSHLRGKAQLALGTDHFPSVAINLQANQSASVRGTVEDEKGRAISGIAINVMGYDEHVLTPADGSFILPAHAADGQTVRLHAEAKHYLPLDQDHPAGNTPALLVLHRDYED